MHTLSLFNTLTKKKEEFEPIKQGGVSLYTCGPTVYNFAHIGNLRTFVLYDLLRRTLEADGYAVNHVMNITDVGHLTSDADEGEDKIEKGAAREGKTAWEVASFYTDAFLEDARQLNLLQPSKMPRATDHIQEQIDLIKQLEEGGHTYETSDGVYFDTSTFSDYGAMARLDVAGLQEGARVEKNEEKRNVTDFALWKFSPKDQKRQMEWESPWGVGFPGWHLECSAMAMKYLGDTIDIHGGGVDHVQVHHTNEIAQSEAATGKQFARFWVHGEFLLIDEGRMGKSEGNFITLADVIKKGYSPLAYRYFLLSAHYRSKLNFTWKALDGASQALNKLVYALAQAGTPSEPIPNFTEHFMDMVNDDLNMPQALAVMWEMMKSDNGPSAKAATLYAMDLILGLGLKEQAEELRAKLDEAGKEVEELLEKRTQARSDKNYEQADEIRDQIQKMGFIVEDTDDGPILRPAN
ncbi:MAG: cysteine--tRNA ligase [Candidatus Kerfeldbacteria bacterium]